jgi:hypothetical protein
MAAADKQCMRVNKHKILLGRASSIVVYLQHSLPPKTSWLKLTE